MKKILLILFILSGISYSQELNCNVDVNFESLPVNNRELLSDFAGVIENYMNTTRFTETGWDGAKIDCSMSIFFTSAGSDVDYSAQLVIVSQRPVYKSINQSPILTVNDGQWSFKYERGQALYAGQTTFDPLTSFLDFYAMVIIGFDWDTWEEYGGTRYFQKAQDIVNIGATSAFSNGWLSSSSPYNRWGLINEILAEKYSKFRSAIFDYHYGIDIYQQNQLLGEQKIVSLIDVLYNIYQTEGGIKSVFIRTFFDAKYREVVEHLKGYPDLSVYEKLKKIDPPHTSTYEGAIP